MSVYLVVGRGYRGHSRGERFEATLDSETEQRAIRAGAIELVERRSIAIQAGAFKPPAGWHTTNGRS